MRERGGSWEVDERGDVGLLRPACLAVGDVAEELDRVACQGALDGFDVEARGAHSVVECSKVTDVLVEAAGGVVACRKPTCLQRCRTEHARSLGRYPCRET